MTVNKITNPPSQKDVIDKVNEIIDDFTLDELANVNISSPTAGQNLTYDATSQVWKNTSTSATVAWGGITGTLADQTDLKNALDNKYDASNPNGYTSNVGTVTSVNNINPNSSGNVSLSVLNLLKAGTDLEIVSLPLGYTELEYIDGTGLSRYINTNLLITPSMNFYFKGAHISGSGVDSYFGTRNSTTTQNGVMFRQTGTVITVDFFGALGTRWTINHARQDNDIIEFRSNNLFAEVLINGTSLGTNQFTAEASTLLYPLFIKALNNGGSPALGDSGIRIYRFTINGVCDLIPARRNSDNVVGMYDVVRNQFFPSSGSGSFTGGNSVNPVINFTNNTGYITKGVSNLTYYTPTSSLATVATSGNYNDLTNTPTIPTVGNGTITFTQGGVTKGTITANQTGDTTIAFDAGGGSGATRNIGEIVESTIPLTDAGLHLLDGALIQGSGIYSAFVTYIAGLVTDYPDLFETEANWQSAVNTYGACGKFVYDSVNNTVRLPKITGKIEGTTDVTALGDLVEQFVRLPNITGGTGLGYGIASGSISLSGAYDVGSGYTSSYLTVNGSGATRVYDGFDASKSSSVYSGNGSDTKIHEQSINVLYYIVIATTTKTEIEVDIDQVATDLNGKADTDLTNCTDVANIKMAHNAMPSNTYTDLTLGASGATYTAPADGYLFFLKQSGAAGQEVYIAPQNEEFAWAYSTRAAGEYVQITVPWGKGKVYKVLYSLTGATLCFRFVYAIGSESEAS